MAEAKPILLAVIAIAFILWDVRDDRRISASVDHALSAEPPVERDG